MVDPIVLIAGGAFIALLVVAARSANKNKSTAQRIPQE